MNISISQKVFPSYNQIRSKLIQKQNAEYKNKMVKLNAHLTQIQNTYDFKVEHDEIKQSILLLAQPLEEIPFFKDPVKIEPAHRFYVSRDFNSESLNYYIGDDGEADNNYQTFLKFKKKALERDLQEEQLQKHKNKKQKRKQREEEEQFFKNLYKNSQTNVSQNKGTVRVKSALNKSIKQSSMKENDSKFVSSMLKSRMQSTSKPLRKVATGIVRTQQQQNEKNACENNRKYLTENYLQILKKLQNTNIVKWRVLNQCY